MILDVHFAFLVASLCVLFGLTYSIGQFLEYQIKKAKERHQAANEEEVLLGDTEVMNS